MNPFSIFVLYTYRQVDGLATCEAFGFTDEAAARAAGEKLAANPALPGLTFMVLPLQELIP